jgi:multidrug efflux pump subunit AcrB
MSSFVGWFARNSVAANLLMALLFLGGLSNLFLGIIRKESFPQIPAEQVSVTVVYPGATPEEVEESICV